MDANAFRMSKNPLSGDAAFLVGALLGFGAVIGGAVGYVAGRHLRWAH